jgi:hypothetical protein
MINKAAWHTSFKWIGMAGAHQQQQNDLFYAFFIFCLFVLTRQAPVSF